MSHHFKVCIECVHCAEVADRAEFNCTHPTIQHPSLVTGRPVRVECCSARMSPCGADGKYFEKRADRVEGAA